MQAVPVHGETMTLSKKKKKVLEPLFKSSPEVSGMI